MVLALTVDRAERDIALGKLMNELSQHVVPANAGTHTPRPRDLGK
jgi:hypothetical protein